MKKLIASIATTAALTAALTLGAAAPAGAHNVGPCNDSGEPGNSDYAQHHIVPATLGAGGHIPGSHGGYSVCLGTGRLSHQP